ncbi:MAG: hypothetical protein E6K70_20845 [Planctomycetota bacterium]|nr:MAG: hypothetical protein E6K70_20845 [Planctomycetota bacterium]
MTASGMCPRATGPRSCHRPPAPWWRLPMTPLPAWTLQPQPWPSCWVGVGGAIQKKLGQFLLSQQYSVEITKPRLRRRCMGSARIETLLRHIHRLAAAPHSAASTDAELVKRVASRADDGAFEALLLQHGPMVLRVCRRVLHNLHDAEDAFQATFLVLARKAVALLLTMGILVAGGSMLAHRAMLRKPLAADLAQATERAAGDDGERAKQVRTDTYGDPLPPGAIARLGSTRLRHAWLSDATFAPDGKAVLTAGRDGRVRAWSVATADLLWAKKLEGSDGLGLTAISPDGRSVTAVRGQQLLVFEVRSGKEVARLPHKEVFPLPYLVFSPDGRTVLAGFGFKVILWEWAGNKRREIFLPMKKNFFQGYDSTYHCNFSFDSKRFVTGAGSQQALCVWDVASGAEVRRFDFPAHISAFTADGKFLAAIGQKSQGQGYDSSLHVWDLATGREVLNLPLKDRAFFWWMEFARDGKTVALGSEDTVHLLDTQTWKESRALRDFERVTTAFFPPDGRIIATMSGRVQLWEVASGKELHARPGHSQNADAAACSRGGRFVATASWVGDVQLWEGTTGGPLRVLKIPETDKYVRNLAFSQDGKKLWAGNLTGHVYSWDVTSGRLLTSVHLIDPDPARYADFKAFLLPSDSSRVATCQRSSSRSGDVSAVQIWEAVTGKLLAVHVLPQASRIAWAPGGNAVTLATKEGWQGPLTTSSDGRLLAASGADPAKPSQPVVGIWEAASGRQVAVVPTGQVSSLALAPDNRSLITADASSVRIWDVATLQQRYAVSEPEIPIEGLYLSPDGGRATTSMADATLLVWDLTRAGQPHAVLASEPDAKTLEGLWINLASEDAGKAYAAIWTLVESPQATLAILKERMRPGQVEQQRVNRLIDDLRVGETGQPRRAGFAQGARGQAAT